MSQPQSPTPAPWGSGEPGSPAFDLDARTRALCELRGKMVELYTQLEYLKLMLKLGVR